jgi:hypothetical protein
LEYHVKAAGPAFPKFAQFIRLLTIDVYGNPGKDLVERLRQKARMPGEGIVRIHRFHAGFVRFGICAVPGGEGDA